MKNQKNKALVLLLMLASMLPLQSQTVSDTLPEKDTKIQVLMDNAHLNSCGFRGQLTNSFCKVNGKDVVVLASGNTFYLLEEGRFYRLAGGNINDSISSFGMMASNKLVVVVGDRICALDSNGTLFPMFQLADTGMEITVDDNIIYAYDKYSEEDMYSLYAYVEEGEVRITTIETPINDVVGTEEKVCFCSDNLIYELDVINQTANVLCVVEEDETIISLAVDKRHNILYFSTEDYVCRFVENNVELVGVIGGTLLFDEKGLLVFDAKSRFLYRMMYSLLDE